MLLKMPCTKLYLHDKNENENGKLKKKNIKEILNLKTNKSNINIMYLPLPFLHF